ncbi:hypothetical protein SDC9_54722 [bioreactor metagenome]|uniref:Uncharacterized protein n=1 Tax=bioreactor metagenome TaxID=1076179 RepID=A0A644WWX7_9ZZZZ
MKKLIILLDLDDVLNDQNNLWVQHLNSRFGFCVKYDDISEWNMSKFFPSLNAKELYEPVLSDQLIHKMTAPPEAKRITNEWNRRGHKIVVTTATSTKNIDSKVDWLYGNYEWFSYEQLILTHRKQLVMGDVLVDDGVHNLIPDVHTRIEPVYTKLCFDRPWNRSFDCEANGIARVHSFSEIDEVIRKLEMASQN